MVINFDTKIIQIDYSKNKIFYRESVQYDSKKYSTGKQAYKTALEDILNTREMFNDFFIKNSDLFIKLNLLQRR